jgi:hypothetical protein
MDLVTVVESALNTVRIEKERRSVVEEGGVENERWGSWGRGRGGKRKRDVA